VQTNIVIFRKIVVSADTETSAINIYTITKTEIDIDGVFLYVNI
jgi:hypothetical protein